MSAAPVDLAAHKADEIGKMGAPRLPSLDLASLAGNPPKPQAFAISQLVPCGEVTLFTGAGSAGKSLVAQQFATAAAAGIGTLGFDIEPAPAIYLTCEDSEAQLHWRQWHICQSLGVDYRGLVGRLELISRRGEIDNELNAQVEAEETKPSALYRRIATTIEATGARHVWLDHVAHLFHGNENDRGEVTRFVNLLNRLAGETGASIVLLGHPNKGGDDYSGSTGWTNAVRSRIFLEHDEETDVRTIRNPKSNYARKGQETRFLWIDWAFVLEDDLPPDRARSLRETATASADNDRFMACLAEMLRQRRPVSESRNASNYAPKVFAGMAEAKGIGPKRLAQAMDRLFRLDRVGRAELWKGPDRKPVFGLCQSGEGTDDVA
ncbi:MAG: AAA family ATPase [Alphaproteobacteria bacterium]|nr:AAA family ATPase [Alphaproteobacteria bacterium]